VDFWTSPERTAEIAIEHCRPVADFHWYKVGKDVGNVRNQGPQLIEPVEVKYEGPEEQ
jgi:putative SOS response-associated peptidase YedK